MIRSMLGIAAALLLATPGALPAKTARRSQAEAQRPATGPLLPLTIRTAAGPLSFKVEIARTQAEQARGLMFRTSLGRDRGMLFPFKPARPAAFWMRNTVIPLDMIFIRPDGTIARIAANTKPYSLASIESGEPVSAVLEIGGGVAARVGIREGDRVSWRDPAPAG